MRQQSWAYTGEDGAVDPSRSMVKQVLLAAARPFAGGFSKRAIVQPPGSEKGTLEHGSLLYLVNRLLWRLPEDTESAR